MERIKKKSGEGTTIILSVIRIKFDIINYCSIDLDIL